MILPRTIILHYKKLIERKQNIINQFNKYNFIEYSFYENYDQNEINSDHIKKYYQSSSEDLQSWTQKVSLWGKKALHYHNPILSLPEISLTIKFGKVFQQLAQETFDYCIIFEDDVILCDDFQFKFYDYLGRTPDNWDAVYFNSLPSLEKNNKDQEPIHIKNHPSSRGGASTLFKHKTITDLAKTWFPFNLISDWELSAQHHIHNHIVYWWEPPLTTQGSKTGLFKTSL